jgi:biofilm PGA synthesis N-glycosyltransferase PgaC
MIIGLVPAHNEADGIVASLESILPQVDQLIVISDNSTDSTVELARAAGATVIESIDNSDKKAGALNQALGSMLGNGDPLFDLPWLSDDDLVLVMDADSRIDDGFVARAIEEFEVTPDAGAVGGVFLGDPGGGLVAQLQRNEYVRYAREVSRRGARAWVLSGTASVLRVDVLRAVTEARRDGTLPGDGNVYDTLALTEDNELTLAIKTLGYRTMSPRECVVRTEVMATWEDLWHQRVRWQRGALENLRNYGLTKVTRPYFGQQTIMAIGLFAMWLFVALTVAAIVTASFRIHMVWLAVGMIFLAERIVTVWEGERKGRVVAAVMVIEFAYDIFLQAVIMRSVWDIVRGRQATWHHPTDEDTPAVAPLTSLVSQVNRSPEVTQEGALPAR